MRVAIAFFALFLGSCAAVGAESGSSNDLGEMETLEGWIQFSEGFQLWPEREDVGTYGTCISGALPRHVYDRARRRFEGQKVRITGRFADPPRIPTEFGVQEIHYFKGTRYDNHCFGDRVMLGERIEPAE